MDSRPEDTFLTASEKQTQEISDEIISEWSLEKKEKLESNYRTNQDVIRTHFSKQISKVTY